MLGFVCDYLTIFFVDDLEAFFWTCLMGAKYIRRFHLH